MGNQSSREQQKGTESLLSSWSLKQQTQLKEQYTQLLRTSSEKQEQADDDAAAALTKTIPTDRLAQAIIDRETPIQPELATALSLYIAHLSNNNTNKRASSSNTVSFNGFLTAIRNVNHSADATTTALYTTYSLAYQKYQCTLETFVLWLVKTAIPIWFEGSGIAKPTDPIWHQQENDSNPPQRLMRYLVYREQKRKERRKMREQEEMALWADDTTDTKQKEKAQHTTNVWHDQATQTSRAVDESIFTSWITDAPIVLTLFQIASSIVFFGKTPASVDNDDDDDNDKDARYQDRIAGRLSPAIQKPSGNMFGKGELSKLLTPYDYFMLTRSLPANARSWSSYEQSQHRVSTDLEHQLIFSSRRDGTSWQVFVNRIVYQGATLLVIKTKDGSVFGAYADEEWKPVTDWYGNSSNFLFRIRYPTSGGDSDEVLHEQNQLEMDTWDGGRASNSHFQYLCWGKQSLPNALVMGGQFDYAGLWLDSNFVHGHSKAGPVCTTYQSPQLSLDQKFTVDEIEVFLVRPLLRDDDDMVQEGGGVLNRTEDMEFMEMAGKKLYSRDLQEPERLDDDDDDDDGEDNAK